MRVEIQNRGRRLLLLGGIAFLAAGCAHTGAKGDAAGEGSETRLATVDFASTLPRSLFFSPDGRHAVWVARAGEQFQIVLDGAAGPLFDSIGRGPVVLSPDGRRLAYLAENKTNKQLSVVADGAPGPEYEKILAGTPIFSPDSRRFAYAAQKEKKRFIMLDGAPGPPFDDVLVAGFSPDSRHLVYYATEEKNKRVVIDDQTGPSFDAIGPVYFSPASEKRPASVGYVGLRGSELIQVSRPLR